MVLQEQSSEPSPLLPACHCVLMGEQVIVPSALKLGDRVVIAGSEDRGEVVENTYWTHYNLRSFTHLLAK